MCYSKLIQFNSEEDELHYPEAVGPDAEERTAEAVCSQVSSHSSLHRVFKLCSVSGTMP